MQVIPLQFREGHWVEAEGSRHQLHRCRNRVDVVSSLKQAYEVGYGLGMFHQLIADLPSEQCAPWRISHHPSYLADYNSVFALHRPTEHPGTPLPAVHLQASCLGFCFGRCRAGDQPAPDPWRSG